MSNHSIIEHRASYYFIRIEEDFLAICSNGKCSPHCKALILAILEHWMNTKRAKGEGNYVYLTIPQWIKHTYMLYERNIIISCIQELLEEGLIIRRQIIIHDQKTFEYTLEVDAIHKLIRELPQKPEKETLPNLAPYLAHKARAKKTREDEKAKQKGVVEKSTTPVENSTTVIEKSTTVVEKPTQQRLRTQTPNLNSNIDSKERKNDDTEQNTNISAQERSSHSSIQASSFSSSSQEKIVLTEDEQRIIEFGKKTIFKARLPELTEKLRNECAELALHIETQEQFNSLLDYVKAKLKPPYHLKNMVNALNDWLQTQTPVTEPLPELPSEPVVTDEELADEIFATARLYQDEENFEAHLRSIESFKKDFRLSNYSLYDKIVNARGRANPERSDIQDFFYRLRCTVM